MNVNNLKLALIQRYPALGRYLRVKYGLIIEPPRETDYVLGASPLIKTVLQPTGQWLDYLPAEEKQQGNRVETMACTCFSLLNVIEMLAKRQYDKDWNQSDRFTAKLSGVTANGNSMDRVLDSVRKLHGSVDETDWPANIETFTWSQFYTAIPPSIQNKGLTFVNDYSLGYEMVPGTPRSMKEGLKYSPLYVAGYAWYLSNGLYRSAGTANHAFTIVGYEEGKHWLAFDSYSPFVKKLAWDFSFSYGKLIVLRKGANNGHDLAAIKKLLERGLTYIMRVFASGEVYRLTPDGLEYVDPEELKRLAVIELQGNHKLVGVDEKTFNDLISV